MLTNELYTENLADEEGTFEGTTFFRLRSSSLRGCQTTGEHVAPTRPELSELAMARAVMFQAPETANGPGVASAKIFLRLCHMRQPCFSIPGMQFTNMSLRSSSV